MLVGDRLGKVEKPTLETLVKNKTDHVNTVNTIESSKKIHLLLKT